MHSGYQSRSVFTPTQEHFFSNPFVSLVDGPIKDTLRWLTEISGSMFMKLSAVVFMTPIFLIPGVIVGILGGWVGQIYMAAQLSVKREMSNAKAPVVGQ